MPVALSLPERWLHRLRGREGVRRCNHAPRPGNGAAPRRGDRRGRCRRRWRMAGREPLGRLPESIRRPTASRRESAFDAQRAFSPSTRLSWPGLASSQPALGLAATFSQKRGLVRIDARRNRVQSITPLPSGPLVIASGQGSLWVARLGGSSVERATGKVTGRFALRLALGSQSLATTSGRRLGTERFVRSPRHGDRSRHFVL